MSKQRYPIQIVAAVVLVAVGAWASQALRGEPKPAAIPSASQAATPAPNTGPMFESRDLYRLKSVGDVQISPDGTRIAYSVQNSDRPGRPYSQVWIVDVATGHRNASAPTKKARRVRAGRATASRSRYFGREESGAGVIVSRADGSGAVMLAPVERHESSAAVHRRAARVVARRQADRVRLGHARPRDRTPTATRW